MEDMILFNGRSSADFEMIVTEYPVLSRGVRRGDSYQIAGRNGTQIREDDTFENYAMTYKVAFPEDRGPSITTAEIAGWLLGSSGFCRLEDTFEPEYYRLARFAGPLNVSQLLDKCGKTPLAFDCQPERFLKSGEKVITLLENVDLSTTITAGSQIINPCAFAAKPLIRITGRGQIWFLAEGSDFSTPLVDLKIQMETFDTTIEIDCASYAVQKPAAITYRSRYPELPTLYPGENTFSVSNVGTDKTGYITKLEIIPRWWTA